MLWFAEIAGGVDPKTPHVINDLKTPRGASTSAPSAASSSTTRSIAR